MSLNHRRNVFTLGNFHIPLATPQQSGNKFKRRQTADLFARDPFKIQSYNFRYANRPKYPLPDFQQKISNPSSLKDCKTFFYNYDFAKNSNNQKSVTSNNVNCNLTKFQDNRRKKYLQNPTTSRNCGPSSCNSSNSNNNRYNSNILNLYYDNQNTAPTSSFLKTNGAKSNEKVLRSNYPSGSKNDATRNSFYFSNGSLKDSMEPKGLTAVFSRSPRENSQSSITRGVSNNRKRSSSTGCSININIKSSEDSSISDNVTVNIQSDSLYKNFNISNLKDLPKHEQDPLESSEIFKIDKKLSKFSSNNVKEMETKRTNEKSPVEKKLNTQRVQKDHIRDKQRDSFTALNSIYSSQRSQQYDQNRGRERFKASTSNNSPQLLYSGTKTAFPRLGKSAERLPSLIPFKSNNNVGNFPQRITNGISSKKSFLQRVKDNLGYSSNDLTRPTSSKITNSSSLCSNNLSTNPTKLSNSSKPSFLRKFDSIQHPTPSSLPKLERKTDLKSAASLHRSHFKLPLNVNINLFTDTLRYLRA